MIMAEHVAATSAQPVGVEVNGRTATHGVAFVMWCCCIQVEAVVGVFGVVKVIVLICMLRTMTL